jgi:hypothetical protein
MRLNLIAGPGFQLEAPPDWENITDQVEPPDTPFTLGKKGGVGAFQFSVALYRAGPIPSPTGQDLLELVFKLAGSLNLGQPLGVSVTENSFVMSAASYRGDHHFMRIWYFSDGKNIMLSTYTCDLEHLEQGLQEVPDCEVMLRTVQFDPNHVGHA